MLENAMHIAAHQSICECRQPRPVDTGQGWICNVCGAQARSIPFRLHRRRESITADEVLAKLAKSNTGENYTAEKTFAMGLIELTIAEIINGNH